MGKHEAPAPQRSAGQRLARHALNPVVHIIILVTLHSTALVVVEKTPLLSLLFIH